MVFLKNSDYIVTLMSDEELITKCGAYFHPEEKRSVTCGRFTATTQSVKEFNYGVKERKLEVIDNNSKEKEKRVVTQYQYHTWDDKDVYEDKEALMGIMKVVNKSEVRRRNCGLFLGVERYVLRLGLKLTKEGPNFDLVFLEYQALRAKTEYIFGISVFSAFQ